MPAADVPKASAVKMASYYEAIASLIASKMMEDGDKSVEKLTETLGEAKMMLFQNVELLHCELRDTMKSISSFIPPLTITRHNKHVADRDDLIELLKQTCDFVALKSASEVQMLSSPPMSPTGSSRVGKGLGDLKLAEATQARRRHLNGSLYRLFGMTHAEKSTLATLTVPTDLATNWMT